MVMVVILIGKIFRMEVIALAKQCTSLRTSIILWTVKYLIALTSHADKENLNAQLIKISHNLQSVESGHLTLLFFLLVSLTCCIVFTPTASMNPIGAQSMITVCIGSMLQHQIQQTIYSKQQLHKQHLTIKLTRATICA